MALEFNRITLDFVNGNCSISLNGVNHLFTSSDNFKSLTGYPFENTHLMFFEPERAIFVVERSGPETVSGEDLEEIIWIIANKDNIIQAAHNDGYGELPPSPPLSAFRNEKLFSTDWMVIRHRDQIDVGVATTLTNTQYQNLLIYRQALRDLSKDYTIDNVVWPLMDL
jgi:hypothetical protein